MATSNQIGNTPAYRIIPGKCISCTKCRMACPGGCISNSKPRIIDRSLCQHCGTCYNICPVSAVEKI